MTNGSGNREQELPRSLRGILVSYRESLPDPEPSATFMPRLWERIEARQTITYSFGRFAGGFVSAAAALCLILSGLLLTGPSTMNPLNSATYVEILADDEEEDLAALVEPLESNDLI